ncbi:hypothetical protein Tco_1341282 [Tanacetum coccineum]
MKETSHELLENDQKKKIGTNNEAKMTLYNALPQKEYVKMSKRFGIHSSSLTKGIHKSRIARLIFSLKNMRNPDYSSKNHVLKFLRAFPLKWRAKVTAIKKAKDLTTLPLDELIGNIKVYETILGIDGIASKPIKDKIMPITLKDNINRGQTSNDSISQDKCDDDEEINLMAKNFKKLFQKGVKKHDKFDICKKKTKGGSSRCERSCYNCGDRNNFINDCPKSKRNKAFVREAYGDNEDGNKTQNDATCLMAFDSQESLSKSSSSINDLYY